MARQFKRAYELTITPADGEQLIIRDLKLIFEITKSVLSFPNLGLFNLYNPAKATLSALERKFTKVTLSAGYANNLSLIFKGEVRNVFQGKTATDRIVTFYAGDGERDWQNATFNKTLSAKVDLRSVINDILTSFEEVTVGVVEGVNQVADKLRGQVLSGTSKDLLDQLADEYAFNWNIQDGEVIITPVDAVVREAEVVVITALTGMLGSPTVTEIGADVTTLLNPKLLPNTAFKIDSVNANVQLGNLFFRQAKRTSGEGLYKVQEVVFKGDSREGEWSSTVKGRTLNG